jgi:hypothetical protein
VCAPARAVPLTHEALSSDALKGRRPPLSSVDVQQRVPLSTVDLQQRVQASVAQFGRELGETVEARNEARATRDRESIDQLQAEVRHSTARRFTPRLHVTHLDVSPRVPPRPCNLE